MTRVGIGLPLLIAPVLFACVPHRSSWAASPAPAVKEVRDFAISVDGKLAGTYRMTIDGLDGTTTVMSAEADVRVSKLIFKYVYTYRGREVWQRGELQHLEADINDDGKRLTVALARQGEQFEVVVNGHKRRSERPVCTTTFWQLPAVPEPQTELAVFDVDSGECRQVRLRLVETKQVDLAGRSMLCSHVHLTGLPEMNLWYDQRGRLVQQIYVDDGHPTELKLTAVRMEALPIIPSSAFPTAGRNGRN